MEVEHCGKGKYTRTPIKGKKPVKVFAYKDRESNKTNFTEEDFIAKDITEYDEGPEGIEDKDYTKPEYYL